MRREAEGAADVDHYEKGGDHQTEGLFLLPPPPRQTPIDARLLTNY